MNDSITKGFGDHKFNIFAGNIEFYGDIFEVDVGVSQGDPSQTNSEDDLVKSQDHGVESVFLEGGLVEFYYFVEILQLSLKYDLTEFVVRIDMCEDEGVWENLPVRYFSEQ